MDSRKLLVLISTALLLSACAGKQKAEESQTGYPPPIAASKTLPPVPPPVILQTSSFKKMDVFSGKTFTMRAERVPVGRALFAICSDLGLNLIIDPGINEQTQITLNFTRTPAEDALDLIMDMTGLFYEIRGNVLRVKLYATKMFAVPHIPSSTTFDASLGGDVLGGSSGGGSGGGGGGSSSGGGGGGGSDYNSNLSGNFSLAYKRTEGTEDFYTQLEENIANILGTGSSGGTQDTGADSYTLNRLTGSLSVHTTRKKMIMVEDFLDAVFSRATKQVQIEAKIIDVTLSDEWSYGIDWSTVFANGIIGIGQSLGTLPTGTGSVGVINVITDSFSAAINAVGKYGDVDTLANPRLMVMNGQTALISAGTVTPYWEKESTTDNAGSAFQTNVTYNRSNILDGILLGVTPYINDDNTVTMNIVPVSTAVQGTKQILNAAGQADAEAPIMNVKEAGTIIRVDDGAMAVLGGLISTSKEVSNSRIPGLGDIPILGYLFRQETHKTMKRELVIFLKPTIVYSSEDSIR